MKTNSAKQPTTQSYNELQVAYDYFNKALFFGELPPCLITLQRRKRTLGYFSQNRFTHVSGKQMVDEIAMNPEFFAIQPIAETLSTLVHEMAHLWQQHFGKPGRRGYHNREWGEKMQQIGLMPSHTGKPGGRTTGEQMSDYIVEGHQFDKACKNLLTKNFTLSWLDRFPAFKPDKIDGKLKNILKFSEPKVNKSNRVKYGCKGCGMQLWGKPKLKILCGEADCDARPLRAIK